MINLDLVKEVANKVSDTDSILLWDLIAGFENGKYHMDHHINDTYALCAMMLEEVEGEEE